MEWNVIYYDSNRREIRTFNIFSHGGFAKEIEKLSKQNLQRKIFDEVLKRQLMYYFWSKCEYEVVISPWVGDERASVKRDVYWQVMNNWTRFSDYVWEQTKK